MPIFTLGLQHTPQGMVDWLDSSACCERISVDGMSAFRELVCKRRKDGIISSLRLKRLPTTKLSALLRAAASAALAGPAMRLIRCGCCDWPAAHSCIEKLHEAHARTPSRAAAKACS